MARLDYELDEEGRAITPCPHHMEIESRFGKYYSRKVIKVGTLECHQCKYFKQPTYLEGITCTMGE
jgi:hypothetical protein